jgi:predicted permease
MPWSVPTTMGLPKCAYVTCAFRSRTELDAAFRPQLKEQQSAIQGIIGAVNDLRYAWRMLVRSPGFTIAAVALLSAGIGTSVVIFSALEAVWLRTLPVKHPEELVRMVQKSSPIGTTSYFVYDFYAALRDHATTLSAVFGEEEEPFIQMSAPAPADLIWVNLVTPEYFDALGVSALYGRTFRIGDPVDATVLSYDFWRKRFSGDPGVVGKTITLHSHQFLILGVMPRGFHGITADIEPALRVLGSALPLLSDPRSGGRTPDFTQENGITVAGRLKPGATLKRAQDECRTIWFPVTKAYWDRLHISPGTELRDGMWLEPLAHGVSVMREKFGGAIALLSILVALLLLMVCANVAGLMVARNASRREEIVVRLAMGAPRMRLVRQMMIESGFLALSGAMGGIAIALLATPFLGRALPPLRDRITTLLPIVVDISINRRVLAFAIVISAMTVLLFGLAPALVASRESLDSVLRSARSSLRWRGRRALIVFQIALCTTLLAGAGLLIRTFKDLHDQNPGFDRDHIAAFTVNPGANRHSTQEQAHALRVALIERIRELPGVINVGITGRPLMRGSGVKATYAPTGERAALGDEFSASLNIATPEYFETMGIGLLAGRNLEPSDSPAIPKRVVVNEAFARHFFGSEDPLGKTFGNALDSPAKPDFEIIGVVADTKYRSMREPAPPTAYQFMYRDDMLNFYVRTRSGPESVIQPVRAILAKLDPTLSFSEIHTMNEEIDASTSGERLTALLASGFAALAGLLAAIGIYGLLAYAVAQRRREIGIRMAVGARPVDIGGMIIAQALVMGVMGAALGVGGTFLVAPWIRALLYGVRPSDSLSMIFAVLFVSLIAVAASAIPTARAVRVDPAVALRAEN